MKASGSVPLCIYIIAKKVSTGPIYVCGIFVEHSYDIFPEYLAKVPYETPENILKWCSGNIEHRSIPWLFHEYPTNITCIFLGESRKTIVDKAVLDVRWVSLKIWYFHVAIVNNCLTTNYNSNYKNL